MVHPFRTVLRIPPNSHPFGLADRFLCLGSCFATHIGDFLRTHKLQVLQNPCGVLFNPFALGQLLLLSLRDEMPDPATYLTRHGWVYNEAFHGSCAAPTQSALIQQIALHLRQLKSYLHHADRLLLTLGSAVVYRRKATGNIVGNCHKLPKDEFERSMATVEDIVAYLMTVFEATWQYAPKLRIVLTVSPVRHGKDTLPVNSVSKSTLRLVCHTLEQQYDAVDYFPAYELLLDDLRDYRFYADDLMHPSAMAIQYICQAFYMAYGNDAVRAFIPQWTKLNKSLQHQPLRPHAPGYVEFLQHTIRQLEAVPELIDTSQEVHDLEIKLFQARQEIAKGASSADGEPAEGATD